ncbi:MAG: serine/threonine-protein kinase [Planctomycetaceae bacterium]
MSQPNRSQPPLFRELEEVLAEYLQDVEAGISVDARALAERYPAHRSELLEFIAIDQQFRDRSKTNSDAFHKTILSGISQSAGSAPAITTPLQRVGEYDLLEEIDRGGMGVVFKARHPTLRRTVAIKMLLAGAFASEEAERRFRREAAAAARLNHPGIVPVYDVGIVDQPGPLHGQTWFAMALVEGTDLARRIESELFDSIAAAQLSTKIVEAIHYAHSKGVIHRDLKPANILLDKNNNPHITDFGLSRCHDDNETQLTAAGQIFGTPGYMSPEQAAGKNESVGPTTDIYSLGAVMYCMLTGRPPFRASSTVATLQQVTHDAPAPPRLLNRSVHPDLESIILKCLEKNSADRYSTAEELKLDLESFLRGESVSAASINLVGYLGRVLGSSRNSEFLEGWSRALYAVSAIVLIFHVALQFLPLTATQSTLVNAGKYVLLLGVIWRARDGILTPQNPVERTIWSLWIGYILTYLTTEIMVRIVKQPEFNLYAIMSLVSSVILLVLGGQLWGGCYVIGGLFAVLAPTIAALPDFAVILFGALWSFVFFQLGRRYQKQSRSTGC